jgi:uncharacterized membrane protein YgcG
MTFFTSSLYSRLTHVLLVVLLIVQTVAPAVIFAEGESVQAPEAVASPVVTTAPEIVAPVAPTAPSELAVPVAPESPTPAAPTATESVPAPVVPQTPEQMAAAHAAEIALTQAAASTSTSSTPTTSGSSPTVVAPTPPAVPVPVVVGGIFETTVSDNVAAATTSSGSSASGTSASGGSGGASSQAGTATAHVDPVIPPTPPLDPLVHTNHTTLETGTAVAVANVVNMVNTNFVNSTGDIAFANLTTGSGGIDTRNPATTNRVVCSDGLPCTTSLAGTNIDLKFLNKADIENHISALADTGANTLEETGIGALTTGDAFASANIVNLANLNLVNSHYFLLLLNAFKGIAGDIVLPSLYGFFDASNALASAGETVLTNDATVTNDINASSDTGGNTVESESSTTHTGASLTYTNLVNTVNTDIVNNTVSLLFRISGAWNGEVFGAPEGLSWTMTPEGILFTSAAFNALNPAASFGGGTHSIDADNTARILNDVTVGATTGDNTLETEKSATLATGDARSVANVVNVANANIIGKNWMLAVVNIFGDFTGNIAFGQPDLWIGGQVVDVPAQIAVATPLTYSITIKNLGDSVSTLTKVTATPDAARLRITGSSTPHTIVADGSCVWSLGTLAPKEIQTITYTAEVIGGGAGERMQTVLRAAERENDAVVANNTDSVSVFISGTASGGGGSSSGGSSSNSGNASSGGGGGASGDSFVVIVPANTSAITPTSVPPVTTEQTVPATFTIERLPRLTNLVYPERTTTQMLTVTNKSDYKADSVVLHDKTLTADGLVMHDEVWDLGTVLPHEEIQLTYTSTFADSSVGGAYTFTSTLTGSNGLSRLYANNGVLIYTKNAVTPAIAKNVRVVPQQNVVIKKVQRKVQPYTKKVIYKPLVKATQTGYRVPPQLPVAQKQLAQNTSTQNTTDTVPVAANGGMVSAILALMGVLLRKIVG